MAAERDTRIPVTVVTGALGVSWIEPVRRRIGPWGIRNTWSHEGPPFIELIEGEAGSPWEATGPSRMDHIGRWTSSWGAEQRRLAECGLVPELDTTRFGVRVSYHRGPKSGARIALFDDANRVPLYTRLGIDAPGPPPP